MTQTIRHYNWVMNIHLAICKSISQCYPRSWQENHISYTWLKTLTKSFPKVKISEGNYKRKITWDAYKMSGALEKAHGDIAILVCMEFENKNLLEGVGFMEAKRVYEKTGQYNALRRKQLKYQLLINPYHQILLYDYQSNYKHMIEHRLLVKDSHSTVIPTPHVLAYRSKERSLHNLGTPLSIQLCNRYLQGHDLNYDADFVEAVKNGVAGGVNYLLVAYVSQNMLGEPSLRSIEINREQFEPLGEVNE